MLSSGGTFPAGWDRARDLLVVVGRGGEELLRRAGAEGQERSIAVLPAEADRSALPPRTQVAHTPLDVLDAILRIPGALPKRVAVRRQGDPWVTDELLREVARTVEDALRTKRFHAAAVGAMGPRWLAQGLANLPRLARVPSIAPLRGAFARRPCVIVSPGPSLERNVHLLPELKGRALLVTSSRALTSLSGAGVVPDLVVVADPGDLLRHFEGVDAREPEALVAGATSAPSVLDLPYRRSFSFASNAEIDDWIFDALGESARLRTGGSVACSALSLALHLGCDPIAFVGQDLSFPDGRYYAAGNVDAEARVKSAPDGGSFYLAKPPGTDPRGEPDADGDVRVTRRQEVVWVPGWGGGRVPTSTTFQAFLLWFETVARSLSGERMLWNCTEGGAHVRGMEHRPLAEYADAFCRERFDVARPLDAALASLDVEGRRARVAARLREMRGGLARCLASAERCDAIAREAEADPARLAALHDAEGELSAALRPLRFVSLLAQEEIRAATESAREARDLAENLAAARRLFAVVRRAGESLAGPLDRALAGLEDGAPEQRAAT